MCALSVSDLVPVVMSTMTFGLVLTNDNLTPATAFPVLTVFGIIQHTITMLPIVARGVTDSSRALGRFAVFLGEEVSPVASLPDTADDAVVIRGDFMRNGPRSCTGSTCASPAAS